MASNSTDQVKNKLSKLTKVELIELIEKLINEGATSPETIKNLLRDEKNEIEKQSNRTSPRQSSKQNTPGLGIEFEVHVPAYFALLLNNDEDVQDFRLQSNVRELGNLDDLLIDIETRSGEQLHFAFQLKHKENRSKNLLPTNFEAKGDFNLEKYCEAFKNLKEEYRKYHFVLYTNKNFHNARRAEVVNFTMVEDEGHEFFNTSSDIGNIYKFEINERTKNGTKVTRADYEKFFAQFTLYTGQKSFNDLDKHHISDILKDKECFLKYVDFFRRWHRGEYTNKILDKKTLNIHLVDILLSPFVIKNQLSDDLDENLEFFESVVKEFDATIIDDTKSNFIKEDMDECNLQKVVENPNQAMLRLGKDYKLIDRSTTKLSNYKKLTLLHYFFKKPLIIAFDETSTNYIYEAMKLYKMQQNEIKFVFLGRGVDAKIFPHFRVFGNLMDLCNINGNLYNEMIRRCKLSLQGRGRITLEQLIDCHPEIKESVGVKELFRMLKQNCLIGEEGEILPSHYVPRTVSTNLLTVENVINHYHRTRDLIIINLDGKFQHLQALLRGKGIRVLDAEDYVKEKHVPNPCVMLTDQEYSRKRFEDVCQRSNEEISETNINSDVHYLRSVNEEGFLLVMSTRNTFSIPNQKLKISIAESSIHHHFKSPINILCAQPGMGKSTLLKYLKNVSGPDFWTVRVDLKAHNSFLREKHDHCEILDYFVQAEESDALLKKLKTVFLETRKIIVFLDGLDEVEIECVDNILLFTRELAAMGCRIWISSRQNLQQKLENYWNVFSIEIEELTKQQQQKYTRNRLELNYKEHEIEEIVVKIFGNANVVNNSRLLGIPLQLQIITEIFLDDRKHYENANENMFVLTKMYKIFFEGRYQFSIDKIEAKNFHLVVDSPEDRLENYEIAALQSLLEDDHFKMLNLDLRRHQRFLDRIRRDKDLLGIVVKVNRENKAVFEHWTFAEYFAAKFLANNFDAVRILKQPLLSKKLQNLLQMFNIMLAEESPAHLAVIYQDLNLLKNYDPFALDRGGRNLLQIAICNSARQPSFELFRDTYKCVIKDDNIETLEEESTVNKEIIEYLLTIVDPSEQDELFQLNSIGYSLAFGSLHILEAIVGKHGKPPHLHYVLEKHYQDEIVAYHSLKFGYPNLLSLVLPKILSINNIYSRHLEKFETHSITRFSVMRECAKKNEIIDLLVGDDIDRIVFDEYGSTLLHFAAMEGDVAVLGLLLEKGADINCQDRYGNSALLLAVQAEKVDAATLLLERGAAVEIRTRRGQTPLFWAVELWNTEIIKLLLNKGDDVNRRFKAYSIIQHCLNNDNLDLMNFAIDKGATCDSTDLMYAVLRKNTGAIELLLNKGVDINAMSSWGRTALQQAVYIHAVDLTNFILEKGANVNVITNDGNTILHLAVKYKCNSNMIDLLLNKTEIVHQLHATNKKGLSPLHLAVYQGNVEVVKLMLSKGTDLNKVDVDNDAYPLRFAVREGLLQPARLLRLTKVIRNGPNLDYRDPSNKNIINYIKSRQFLLSQL